MLERSEYVRPVGTVQVTVALVPVVPHTAVGVCVPLILTPSTVTRLLCIILSDWSEWKYSSNHWSRPFRPKFRRLTTGLLFLQPCITNCYQVFTTFRISCNLSLGNNRTKVWALHHSKHSLSPLLFIIHYCIIPVSFDESFNRLEGGGGHYHLSGSRI